MAPEEDVVEHECEWCEMPIDDEKPTYLDGEPHHFDCAMKALDECADHGGK